MMVERGLILIPFGPFFLQPQSFPQEKPFSLCQAFRILYSIPLQKALSGNSLQPGNDDTNSQGP
jgi:hypothetical protein